MKAIHRAFTKRSEAVSIPKASAGLPRSSWWAESMSREAWQDLAKGEAPRMKESKLGQVHVLAME
jgi:hypothetical protein